MLFFLLCLQLAAAAFISPPSQSGAYVKALVSTNSPVSCVRSILPATADQIRAGVDSTGAPTISATAQCSANVECAILLPLIEASDMIHCVDNVGTVHSIGWADSTADLAGDVDRFYLIWATCMVFLMQAGFGMLEVGVVRSKNITNILFKNMLDACVSGVVFWLCGWAFAYGGDSVPGREGRNEFIGSGEFMLVSSGDFPEENYALYVFQWSFAATSATIVSGAIAERAQVSAYIIAAIVLCGLTYPLVVHWSWSGAGWMSPFADTEQFTRMGRNGFLDFAGSGVCHLVGATAAFIACLVLGPRIGRFGPPWASKAQEAARRRNFAPNNMVFAALGVLILWVGWYGFNCGSTLAISGGLSIVAGKVATNTTLGAAGGGITMLILSFLLDGKHWDLDGVMNGILCGLVSITSGCPLVEPWAAYIIGTIGGIMFSTIVRIMALIKVDDPLSAVAVHGGGGLWGPLAVGFFTTEDNLFRAYGVRKGVYGLFYGGGWEQLGVQFIAILVIIGWTSAICLPLFWVLKAAKLFRVTEEQEIRGLDETEHNTDTLDSGRIVGMLVEGKFKERVERLEKAAALQKLK
eukprot:NODE_733_length_1907_cov_229.270787_g680_i0.p1 GENE.NODE_733_length_1907_cov_229.270787_g680_i0~~NODE_733_length_1907_cov_229.270787_g680_i0.p1  ORF type:complete len:597 (+),score=104.16 NODE_733_length_1907_cov_229.270787_g680_i0:53-1792(+)